MARKKKKLPPEKVVELIIEATFAVAALITAIAELIK